MNDAIKVETCDWYGILVWNNIFWSSKSINENWVKFSTIHNALQSTFLIFVTVQKSRFPRLFICLKEFCLVEKSLFLYLNSCLFLYDFYIILWKLPHMLHIIMFMPLQEIISLKNIVLKLKHMKFYYREHFAIHLNANGELLLKQLIMFSLYIVRAKF